MLAYVLVLQLLGSGCWDPWPINQDLSVPQNFSSTFLCHQSSKGLPLAVVTLCLLLPSLAFSRFPPSAIVGVSPLCCLCTRSLVFSLPLMLLTPLRQWPLFTASGSAFSSSGYQLNPSMITSRRTQGKTIREKCFLGPKNATPEGSIRDVSQVTQNVCYIARCGSWPGYGMNIVVCNLHQPYLSFQFH